MTQIHSELTWPSYEVMRFLRKESNSNYTIENLLFGIALICLSLSQFLWCTNYSSFGHQYILTRRMFLLFACFLSFFPPWHYRVLCLLGWCSTTWAMLSTPFYFSYFLGRVSGFCPGPVSDYNLPIYASYVGRITGISHHACLVCWELFAQAGLKLQSSWICKQLGLQVCGIMSSSEEYFFHLLFLSMQFYSKSLPAVNFS
jgi:hypothetical protein